jgi:hypothetical protein
MTVGAEGDGELEVRVEESTRELVLDALEVLAAVTEESLAHACDDEREVVRSRLAEASELHRRVVEVAGPVELSGQEDLVLDVVRAMASHAAYELDALLEVLAGTRDPLSYHALAQLRVRAEAAAGAVETLIACEASRDAT